MSERQRVINDLIHEYNNKLNSAKEFLLRGKQLEEDAKELHRIIEELGGAVPYRASNEANIQYIKPKQGLATPTNYSYAKGWAQKTMFIISQFPEGALVDDIVANIKNIEPHMEEKIIFNNVTNISSKLLKDGHLEATKEGLRNRYKIKAS